MTTIIQCLLACLFTVAVSAAQASRPATQQFGWLEGCWAGERGVTRFQEIWAVVSPELLVGMGMTTEPSKPAEFDYFRIEARGGKPAYVAQPHGAPPTAFDWQAGLSGADFAMFANPAHDFPKRVSYRRVNATSLTAAIDGGAASAGRMEFPMKRVACPGGR